MKPDRSRVMKTAHREWRAIRHRPGATFAHCLRVAWSVEKQRNGYREAYNPDPTTPTREVLAMFVQVGEEIRTLLAA